MANARLPQLAIKANQLKQQDIEFTPFNLQLEPITFDALERGFARDEQRKKDAETEISSITKALGDAQNNLYRDKSNTDFIRNKMDQVNAQINERIQLGDYSGALTVAHRLGKELDTDKELSDRVLASKAFREKKALVKNNNNISNDVKDWWLDTHPFELIAKKNSNGDDMTDENGNIVYDVDFDSYNLPVAQLNIAKYYQYAANLVAERSSSKSTSNRSSKTSGNQSSNTDAQGETKGGGYSKTTSSESSSSNSVHYKDEKDILAVMKELLITDSNFQEELDQDYEVYKWKLSKRQKKIDDLNKKLSILKNDAIYSTTDEEEIMKQIDDAKAEMYRYYKNGSPAATKEEYMTLLIDDNILKKTLSYRNVASSSSRGSSTSYTTHSNYVAPREKGTGVSAEYDSDGNLIGYREENVNIPGRTESGRLTNEGTPTETNNSGGKGNDPSDFHKK